MSAPISTTIRTHEATGQRYAVNIHHDDDHDAAPWEAEDGHGPVRNVNARHGLRYAEGVNRKRPGERILNNDDRNGTWLYDWQAAMRLARADKWGIDPEIRGVWTTVAQSRAQAAARGCYDFLGEWLAMSRGEIAERAVQADYERLRAWLCDDWYYVGVAVVLLGDDDADDEPIPLTGRFDHACWGIESDSDDSYIDEVADDLLADALATRYTDAQIDGTEPAVPQAPMMLDVARLTLACMAAMMRTGEFPPDVAPADLYTAAVEAIAQAEGKDPADVETEPQAPVVRAREPQAVHFATENPNVTVQFKPIPTHPEPKPGPLRTFRVTMQYPYTKWCEKVIEVEATDKEAAKVAAYEREGKDDEDGETFWQDSYEVGDGDAGETEIKEVEDLGEAS